MFDVHMSEHVIERVLPTLRQRMLQILAAAGYALREPDRLTYSVLIDDAPDRIEISVKSPVTCRIEGVWKNQDTLTFFITQFACQQENGQWPLSRNTGDAAPVNTIVLPAVSPAVVEPVSAQQFDGRFLRRIEFRD